MRRGGGGGPRARAAGAWLAAAMPRLACLSGYLLAHLDARTHMFVATGVLLSSLYPTCCLRVGGFTFTLGMNIPCLLAPVIQYTFFYPSLVQRWRFGIHNAVCAPNAFVQRLEGERGSCVWPAMHIRRGCVLVYACTVDMTLVVIYLPTFFINAYHAGIAVPAVPSAMYNLLYERGGFSGPVQTTQPVQVCFYGIALGVACAAPGEKKKEKRISVSYYLLTFLCLLVTLGAKRLYPCRRGCLLPLVVKRRSGSKTFSVHKHIVKRNCKLSFCFPYAACPSVYLVCMLTAMHFMLFTFGSRGHFGTVTVGDGC
jgi:hypothetical protein